MKKEFKFQYHIILVLITCLSVLTIIPSQLLAIPTPPSIQAEAAILIDAKTGTVLFEKNANERHYPASITKIMTALLTIENLSPTDVISFSQDAIFGIERGSSHIGLDVGEQITVDQALHALLLMSANEVANGLAEKTSGSIENFAILMTNRAKELGAQNTHFINPHGLHNENHYTTAYDMALITRAIYNNEYFLEIMSTPTCQIPPTNKTSETRYLAQQHGLMNKLRNSSMYREDVIGGKTGYTDIARHTLVTIGRKNGIDLIAVILKGEKNQIYQDTNALLDYGFDSYQSLELHTPNDTLARLPIYAIKSGKLYEAGTSKISVADTKNVVVESHLKRRELTTEVNLPEYLEIGVKENDVVGSITYINNGKILTQSDLVISTIDFTPAPYKATYPPQSPLTSKFNLLFTAVIAIILFIGISIFYIRLKNKNKFKHKKLKFSKTIK